MVVRSAFTIIELLFAIVIISLTVLSLPMMIQVGADSTEASVKQEAIFAAAAKMMQVLSYPWDENAINPNNTLANERVVQITTGNDDYDRVGTSIFRIGHVQQDLHRRFHEDNTTAFFNVSTLGADVTDVTGIEEMAGTFALNNSAGAKAYKEDYTIDVSVNYISDATPFTFTNATSANPTNVRMVQVDIDDANNQLISRLRAYVTNIGEVDYFHRTY